MAPPSSFSTTEMSSQNTIICINYKRLSGGQGCEGNPESQLKRPTRTLASGQLQSDHSGGTRDEGQVSGVGTLLTSLLCSG